VNDNGASTARTGVDRLGLLLLLGLFSLYSLLGLLGLLSLCGLLGLLDLLVSHILKPEVQRCLIVKLYPVSSCTFHDRTLNISYLNRGTLEFTLESVGNGDIDLGSVEGTATLVDGPVIALELGHGLLQLILRFVPRLLGAETAIRLGTQLEFKLEAEEAVDGLQEVEETLNFRHDL